MNRSATLILRTTAVAAILAATVAGSGAAVAAPDRPRADGPIAQLITSGTITVAQARAVKQAMVAARPDGSPVLTEVLNDLVSAGTLTRAQADAVLATKGPGSIRALVVDGTVTRAQAEAIREACQAERDEYADERLAQQTAVLASLVADGTITQAQADAIAAAIAAKQAARP